MLTNQELWLTKSEFCVGALFDQFFFKDFNFFLVVWLEDMLKVMG